MKIDTSNAYHCQETVTSRNEVVIASYMRVAEIECIEFHEGSEGEQVLLRRGVNLCEEAPKTFLPVTHAEL